MIKYSHNSYLHTLKRQTPYTKGSCKNMNGQSRSARKRWASGLTHRQGHNVSAKNKTSTLWNSLTLSIVNTFLVRHQETENMRNLNVEIQEWVWVGCSAIGKCERLRLIHLAQDKACLYHLWIRKWTLQTIRGRAYGLTSSAISATKLGLWVKKLVN